MTSRDCRFRSYSCCLINCGMGYCVPYYLMAFRFPWSAKMPSVIERLLSAVLLRFELGSTGCYLAATCHTSLERVLDELQQLRTLHALILNTAGKGIYGLDEDGEVTPGNATTLDTLRTLSSQK